MEDIPNSTILRWLGIAISIGGPMLFWEIIPLIRKESKDHSN